MRRPGGYRLAVAGRFVLYFLAIATTILGSVGYLDYQQRLHERDKAIAGERLIVAQSAQTLSRDIQDVLSGLNVLLRLVVVDEYLADPTPPNLQRIEQGFARFLGSVDIFRSVEFADMVNRRAVRIVSDSQGVRPLEGTAASETPPLEPGVFEISPISVAADGTGHTITVHTGLYNGQASLVATISVTYRAERFLSHLDTIMGDSWGQPLLLESDGRPVETRSLRPLPAAADLEALWRHMSSAHDGQIESPAGHLTFNTIRADATITTSRQDAAVAPRFWKVATWVPREKYAVTFGEVLRSRMDFVIVFLAVTALISAWMTRLRTHVVDNAQALRRSRAELAEAQRVAKMGNWVWDIRGNALRWSDQTYAVFGRVKSASAPLLEEFIGSVHPGDRARLQQAIDACLRGEKPYSIDHRIVRPDGTVRHVHEAGEVEFDGQGNAVRMLGTVQDITERKQAEEQLRESEQRFRLLTETIRDVFWMSTPGVGRMLYISPAYEAIWGRSCQSLYDRPQSFVEAVHPDDRQTLTDGLKAHGEGRWDFTYRIVRPDGEIRWISDQGYPICDEQGHLVLMAGVARDVTQRKEAEERLQMSEERFRLLTKAIDDVFWMSAADYSKMLYISPGYEAVWGRSCQSAYEDVRSFAEAVHPDDREQVARALEINFDGCWDYRIIRPDGEVRWIRDHGYPIRGENGEVTMIAGVARDITDQKKAEVQLREAATVFESTHEAIVITDIKGHITAANPAYGQLTGFDMEELLGRYPDFLQTGHYDEAFYQRIRERLWKEGHWQGEMRIRNRGGEPLPVLVNINAVRDELGEISHFVGMCTDIRSIKETEERMRELAHHDALTGLPNRLLFSANLNQAIQHARRYDGRVGLMVLDLDRFKLINDTLGHAAGDELLKVISERLRQCVRAEDTVARLGGDEFVVVLSEIGHAEDAALSAEKIIEAVRQPIRLDGRDIVTSTSIGISIYPEDAADGDGLTKAADAAMYRAKERGRSLFEFYTAELTSRAEQHLSVEYSLRQAVARGELELSYQPQVDLRSGRICGAEALLRWRHPEQGLLLPRDFISVAEDTGLIEEIGRWVLEQACAEASRWRDGKDHTLRLAVNLSGHQAWGEALINTVSGALEKLKASSHHLLLELEVTETVLQHARSNIAALEALRKLGVRLAIDDFGKGYSSLSQLKALPVDALKIDAVFVEDLADDGDSRAIVAAIISMAHSLGLTVVAEGVESQEQLDVLCQLGCDEAQGYWFREPVDSEAIQAMIETPARGCARPARRRQSPAAADSSVSG